MKGKDSITIEILAEAAHPGTESVNVYVIPYVPGVAPVVDSWLPLI